MTQPLSVSDRGHVQQEDLLLDSTTEQIFLTAIETHDFSSLYFENLRHAVDGDLAPISNMLVRFVERFGPEGCDRGRVAEWLFKRANETLEVPRDAVLRKTIRQAIRATA
jgi:hypothetical protein